MSGQRNQASNRTRAKVAPRRQQLTRANSVSLEASRSAHELRAQGFQASLAVVLGSGFHGLCNRVQRIREILYRDIPGFPRPSVPGHRGRLLLARLGDTPALILDGRIHFYEGYPIEQVTFPIRVLAELGVKDLVLTNAAGGIHPVLKPGSFMLIKDHINFMGTSPLRGNPPPGRQRFVDLSEVYDRRLRKLMRRSARAAGVPLREGIYLAVAGPNYETPAEIRAFGRLGADAVGMSTIPEAVVARQLGLQVVGLSCITNRAAGLARGTISHEEVLARGQRSAEAAANVLLEFARFYAEVR